MPTRATLVADIAEWADKPTIVEGSSIANSVLRITPEHVGSQDPAGNQREVRPVDASQRERRAYPRRCAHDSECSGG